MYREKVYKASQGILMLFVLIAASIGFLAMMVKNGKADNIPMFLASATGLAVTLFLMGGFFLVNPNDAKAMVLFGKYVGTVKEDGFWFANPFLVKKKVSLRVRNFETAKLKVNDNHGNPIEIAAVVVWRVTDTAEALFEVDDYQRYVEVQSESAVRGVAQQYPYDAHKPEEQSLTTHTAEVSQDLAKAIQDRLAKAGVEVVEARITHLAYSPEIAAAMLQRQQASAIIAARQKIVEGAVGMVENALELLHTKGVVTLDEERKAAMVSNLLVVLCSERGSQPVVNAGSLY